MTRTEAIQWCQSKLGQAMDYALLPTVFRSRQSLVALLKSNFRMSAKMLGACNNFKILDSIISLNAVNMMNDLITTKNSAKVLLHDKAMFSNLSISGTGMFGFVNMNIPTSHNPSPLPSGMMSGVFFNKLLMTFATTKDILAILVTLIVSKLCLTIITAKTTFSRLVVAFTRTCSLLRTRSCILARGGLVFVRTHITNVYHYNIIAHNAWRSK